MEIQHILIFCTFDLSFIYRNYVILVTQVLIVLIEFLISKYIVCIKLL